MTSLQLVHHPLNIDGLQHAERSLDIGETTLENDEQPPQRDDDEDDNTDDDPAVTDPDPEPHELEDLEHTFLKKHPAIKNYLVKIREAMSKDNEHIPWIYPPDPLTSLIKSHHISFDRFLLPRVFLWKPEKYLPGTRPRCIKPGCGSSMKSNG